MRVSELSKGICHKKRKMLAIFAVKEPSTKIVMYLDLTTLIEILRNPFERTSDINAKSQCEQFYWPTSRLPRSLIWYWSIYPSAWFPAYHGYQPLNNETLQYSPFVTTFGWSVEFLYRSARTYITNNVRGNKFISKAETSCSQKIESRLLWCSTGIS